MFSLNNDENYEETDDEAIFLAVLDEEDNYGLDNDLLWATPCFHYYQILGLSIPAGDGMVVLLQKDT